MYLLVQAPLSIEIAPLLHLKESLFNNSLPASFGARFLFLFWRIGKNLIREPRFAFKNNIVWTSHKLTFRDERSEMSIDELFLVDVLKRTMRMIEIEEEGMRVKLIGLSNDGNKLIQIDLPGLVDFYVDFHVVFLTAMQYPYSYIWYSLIVKHYIIIELLIINHFLALYLLELIILLTVNAYKT